jgi:hypothetical protein
MEVIMSGSVGFHLWNMSKRISEVKMLGRETRALLSEADAGSSLWGEIDLVELTEIVTAAEMLARRADKEWSHLKDMAQAAAPDVLGPTHAGVTVIRNRGNDADGLAALWEAWGETKSVTAARQLSDRFDRLLVRLQIDPRFVMGKRWCAEHQQSGCTHSLYEND